MLKGGMGGVRPLWKTATGVYYFRGWTPLGATKRYSIYLTYYIYIYVT
jgi:hypothetical protein